MKDPEASKPEDWDEDAPVQIVDASATMPGGLLVFLPFIRYPFLLPYSKLPPCTAISQTNAAESNLIFFLEKRLAGRCASGNRRPRSFKA